MMSPLEIHQGNAPGDPDREQRRNTISEYFVYLDPDRWGSITRDDLFTIAEQIRLRTGESAEAVQAYIKTVEQEMPVLTTQIEGLGLTVREFLVRVARDEHNFSIQPLSAYRQIPPREIIKY